MKTYSFRDKQTRRVFLRTCLALPVPLFLPVFEKLSFASVPGPGAVNALAPTPMCGEEEDVTPPQTEGPFFTPNSPNRTSFLEAGVTGTILTLTGQVLSVDCTPLAGALVDFWHTDQGGNYDNAGYRFRGHQFTDAQGRYRVETIVPGLYPGRTRHYHVKVQAPNQSVLTTQLYFPGEPANLADSIFSPELLMAVGDTTGGRAASFNFVLDVSTQNLLKNGSFESDGNGNNKPDSWINRPFLSRSNIALHRGRHSMRHFAANNAGYFTGQVVPNLTAGANYSLSAWTMIPPTTNPFTYRIQIVWRNAASVVLRTDTIRTFTKPTNGWVLAQRVSAAPDGATKAMVVMAVAGRNTKFMPMTSSSKKSVPEHGWIRAAEKLERVPIFE